MSEEQQPDRISLLEQANSDIRSMLNGINITVILLDTSLHIRCFTPDTARLFNLTKTDLGRPLDDIRQNFVDDDLLADARRALEEGAVLEREVMSDEGLYYLCRTQPRHLPDNRIGGVVITVEEITQYKNQQHKIERSMAKETTLGALLRLSLKVTPMAQYLQQAIEILTDTTPWLGLLRRGRIFLTNHEGEGDRLQLVAAYNIPAEQQTRCADVAFGTCLCGIAASTGCVMFAGSDDPRHVLGDGNKKLFYHYCIPICTDTAVLGVLTLDVPYDHKYAKDQAAFLRRVSDVLSMGILRRHSEELLINAKQEADRINLAKSRFLATASHDLRQPLQAMDMLNSVLAKRIDDPKSLMMIADQGLGITAMKELLNALLDISKLDAGAVQPRIADIRTDDLLQLMQAEFTQQAEEKNLELCIVPCSVTIRSDASLLEGIIRNLLSNAIKYTETGKVLLGCRRQGSLLRIEVWDTGPGIPQDKLKEIFKEFRQLNNPARERSMGLGLGLAIVERTARLLEHAIEVKSTPGKCSMFAVTVPSTELRQKVKPSQQETLKEKENAHSKKVFVIEDDALVRKTIVMFLEQSNYHVTAVANGNEALEKLARNGPRPDIVITDHRLPGDITGARLIELIRNSLGRDIPAIILTGDTSLDIIQEAECHDCVLLHKPVNGDELTSHISSLLEEE